MQQTGVIDRLQQKFVGDSNREADALEIQVQDINGLGYEKVAFPFLALLTGLCVAFIQFGFETAIKKLNINMGDKPVPFIADSKVSRS